MRLKTHEQSSLDDCKHLPSQRWWDGERQKLAAHVLAPKQTFGAVPRFNVTMPRVIGGLWSRLQNSADLLITHTGHRLM